MVTYLNLLQVAFQQFGHLMRRHIDFQSQFWGILQETNISGVTKADSKHNVAQYAQIYPNKKYKYRYPTEHGASSIRLPALLAQLNLFSFYVAFQQYGYLVRRHIHFRELFWCLLQVNTNNTSWLRADNIRWTVRPGTGHIDTSLQWTHSSVCLREICPGGKGT